MIFPRGSCFCWNTVPTRNSETSEETPQYSFWPALAWGGQLGRAGALSPPSGSTKSTNNRRGSDSRGAPVAKRRAERPPIDIDEICTEFSLSVENLSGCRQEPSGMKCSAATTMGGQDVICQGSFTTATKSLEAVFPISESCSESESSDSEHGLPRLSI
mmetsp:Transcript_65926/g.137667  ORF Transcript_65926/g.137667 Transcript_65926/m.137667 type:complete len:159 (+) Transcript_65926:453-929(+)